MVYEEPRLRLPHHDIWLILNEVIRLMQVGIFTHMEDHVLDAICEHLQPKLYTEGSVIMRANFPLERMIFIVRGNLVSCGEDKHEVVLREGDFCGEELLVWCLEHSQSQQTHGT